MARSFWKGNVFIKDFVNPLTIKILKQQSAVKTLKLNSNYRSFMPSLGVEDVKVYRRNHVLTSSQSTFISDLLPISLYNGYDFLSLQSVPVVSSQDAITKNLNLSALVTTRELEVSHKVKLSKAARKNKARLVKKKSVILSKSGSTTRPRALTMNKRIIKKMKK